MNDAQELIDLYVCWAESIARDLEGIDASRLTAEQMHYFEGKLSPLFHALDDAVYEMIGKTKDSDNEDD